MEMNIDKRFIYKVLVLFLCVYLALMPAFSYKKVHAALSDKFYNFLRISTTLIIGLQSVGFIGDTTLTPENLENIYNKADAYLHENFGTELEYAEALRQVDQLGLDIASGKIFVPGKYSGKLWYSFLNAVKEELWPEAYTVSASETFLAGFGDISVTFYSSVPDEKVPLTGYNAKKALPTQPWDIYFTDASVIASDNWGNFQDGKFIFYVFKGTRLLGKTYIHRDQSKLPSGYHIAITRPGSGGPGQDFDCYVAAAIGIPEYSINNGVYVPSITAKTANKVKLPTRLPQTVINNINNYIDNSTENLIIAPTSDELPTLPDNYNPNTDDPPDLPGYEDVTPDQPGTTDPEPTPSPTPEPTPTPTAPEYDGSKWVNPIGEFIAGLLEFLKSAFVPTMSIDTSPLTNANFDMANKFPFSLPNTFKTLLITVNAPGKTPVFDMTFDMTKLGFEAPIVWHIDLHEWDTGAEIAKTSLYIIFLLGLILMTKKLFVK